MKVIQIYGKDAEQYAGLTLVLDFEVCKKRIRFYYRNVGQIKARLYSGEKISMPYVVLQKDRRIRDIPVRVDRRRSPRETVLK